MTAQRSDLMTAKPNDPNSLEPYALSLVPFLNPQSAIPSTKSQGVRCQGRETQKLKPEFCLLSPDYFFVVPSA